MTINTELHYGSKSLSVDISESADTASIRFGTLYPRWLHPRKSGETTTIFRLAETIILAEAQRRGRSIVLTFDTANFKLKSWVIDKKTDLGFDMVEPGTERAYRQTVRKVYTP